MGRGAPPHNKAPSAREDPMTGDHDGIPPRRKQAQVLPRSRPAQQRKPGGSGPRLAEAAPDSGGADIRVEDLGNGRARMSFDVSWPLALKVLEFLKENGLRPGH